MPTRTRRDISFGKASRRVPSGGLLAFGDGGAGVAGCGRGGDVASGDRAAVVGAGAAVASAAAFGDRGPRVAGRGPRWNGARNAR